MTYLSFFTFVDTEKVLLIKEMVAALVNTILVIIKVNFTGLGFAGTMVFYWFAQSEQYRDFLAKPIITSLYHRYQWRWLRKEHALEVFLVCYFKCFFS